MHTRHLGNLQVGAIGLGAMPFTMDTRPSERDAVATVHAALDAGVTLIDTADAYTPSDHGPGMNEEVVAKALATYAGSTDGVLVATKGGHTRDGSNWGLNGRPDYLRRACEGSLRRLGVDVIGLYQHHRPDPDVPYEESMGGLRALLDAGLIERAGISNADPDQIRLAHEILGAELVSVQNQFSPSYRSSEPEIAVCAELGLAFLPWSPLGGSGSAKEVGSSYAAFGEVAEAHGVSPQQVCLAWELSLSQCVIAIPGASQPATISDSVAAADLELSDDELTRLSETS
ncbi:MAG: aldo/keto reductase [Propionibacteriales bacterium]|nr:aldo/keto reductase [Propionibacteriales bacterium]